MNNIVASGLIVGVFVMIFFIPFCYCIGVEKMSYGKNVPASKYFLAMIPIYNVIHADINYFGKVWFASFGTFALLTIPLRFLCVFISTDSAALYNISMAIMIIGILFWYGSQVYTSFIIIHDAGIMGNVKAFLMSIIYAFGYYYIGSILWAEINRRQKESMQSSLGGTRL